MLIAQITDLHVGDRLTIDGRDIDTLEGLRRAVAHLNALLPRPDAVVVTGDLVAEETPANYQSVAAALGELTMPRYVIPGNHDDRGMIREVFGGDGFLTEEGEFLHYTVEGFDLRLVALDTHDPGKASGLLCQDRLNWLDARLAEARDRPTLIFMHHPPFYAGIADFDIIGLTGRDAFAEIVARNTQVQAIACGHVHRDIALSWCGTLVAVTPSTGYQYALELDPDKATRKVAEPPAVRLFLWSSGNGLTSHLSYVAP